jgi:hypothetical protein
MMSNKSSLGTGDGTRPTTSGGVDNIGGGESFTGTCTTAGGEISGPAPAERMAAKRKNVLASRSDDSDAFNLHEDLTAEPNKEVDPPGGEKR